MLHAPTNPPAFPAHLRSLTSTLACSVQDVMQNIEREKNPWIFLSSSPKLRGFPWKHPSSSPQEEISVKPGLLVGHSVGPHWLWYFPGNSSSSHCHTGIAKWRCAPSCIKITFCVFCHSEIAGCHCGGWNMSVRSMGKEEQTQVGIWSCEVSQ
jgi:hypothetical protein